MQCFMVDTYYMGTKSVEAKVVGNNDIRQLLYFLVLLTSICTENEGKTKNYIISISVMSTIHFSK